MTTTATAFDFQRDEDGSLTLQSAVFQALGAASACWENLAGAGIFESDRAKEIGERLVEFIREDDVPELLAEVGHLHAALADRDRSAATAYTPPTALMRDGYVRGMRQAFLVSTSEHVEEFDRWLEGVKREAAAQALEHAADAIPLPAVGPYRAEWLRRRAATLRGEAQQ